MTLTVQITIIALGILLITVVLRAAIQKKITESHALMWMLPCILIILGGIFPQLTWFLSRFFDTEYPPAIILTLAIIMLYIILFQDFKVLSVLTLKNKELASHVTLLTGRIEKLEQELTAATWELAAMNRTRPEITEESLAAATQERVNIAEENLAATAQEKEDIARESLAAATQEKRNIAGKTHAATLEGE